MRERKLDRSIGVIRADGIDLRRSRPHTRSERLILRRRTRLPIAGIPITSIATVGTATLAAMVFPAPAFAHPLAAGTDPPLPLEVYLAGAALVVGLSFFIAFVHGGGWRPAGTPRVRRLPGSLIVLLRAVGLLAWAWVVAQFIVGGSSSAEVGTLFTWVYGWVGLAIACALLCPVWDWVDPFATLHDIGAWLLRRLGIAGLRPAGYPAWLSHWPAVAGFAVVVWLELAYRDADMDMVVVGYTVIALAGMTVYGKERWRSQGEVFSIWFGLLGRLARYASADGAASGLVRRQRFPDGLLTKPWDAALVSLVAIATGAILYDGLSQTQVFFDLFSIPDLMESTLLLSAFLGIVVALALGVGARVGMTAIGAGLLPISVGYLIAHYVTFLLGDGQRIIVAIADPFQLGWDLTGTAFFEPSTAWLPTELVWTLMFAAVVGGHVLGAWAGHLRHVDQGAQQGVGRRTQLPLAMVMVGLTTLTLWSLGQAVFRGPGVSCLDRALAERDARSVVSSGASDDIPARLAAEIC